jgi:hypothetical protein
MASAGIRVTSNTILSGCDAFGTRLNAGLAALCEEEAQRGQDAMRTDRGWTDRTGHARDSLTGSYQREGDVHVISLYTTNEEYGLILELAHAGRFAIIRPTADRIAPEVFARAASLIGGSAR